VSIVRRADKPGPLMVESCPSAFGVGAAEPDVRFWAATENNTFASRPRSGSAGSKPRFTVNRPVRRAPDVSPALTGTRSPCLRPRAKASLQKRGVALPRFSRRRDPTGQRVVVVVETQKAAVGTVGPESGGQPGQPVRPAPDPFAVALQAVEAFVEQGGILAPAWVEQKASV
jgi:hypothetical protein